MSFELNSDEIHEDASDHMSYGNQFSQLCDLTGDHESNDLCSPKKRKIDKDGFLCPATPDIPITSSQYDHAKVRRLYEKEFDNGYGKRHGEEHFHQDQIEDGQSQFGNENLPSEPHFDNESLPSESHFDNENLPSKSQFDNGSLPTEELDENVEQQFDITMLKDTRGMNMAEVMEELGHTSKIFHNQWSESFRESENFENLCPVRLDKMIEQAKQLEENLLKQKDLLCNRLNVISHIIRTNIMEGPGGDNPSNNFED